MEFAGSYWFDAPRLKIWGGLNDTAILKAAIPGCTKIEWSGPDTLELEIKVNLGVAHPSFSGVLELSEVTPAEHYTLSGHGKGGLLGHAHGTAEVSLADQKEGCHLAFTATGGGSNTLMRLGKAVLGKSAQHVIDRFFERFAEALEVSVVPVRNE